MKIGGVVTNNFAGCVYKVCDVKDADFLYL